MLTWTLTDNDINQTQVLKSDPKGWQETILKHERDGKYHGITYDFTNEFGFYCKGGGKEMIDAAYLRAGQEADVSLTLHVKCNGKKTKLFTGKLMFPSYRQEWESGVLYSFLDVEKDDIKKLINVREDVKVNLLSNESLGGVSLPSYPYAGYELQMHSKLIRLTSEWENTTNTLSCVNLPTAQPSLFHIAEWVKVGGEVKESNDIPPSFESFSVFNTTIKPIVELDNSYVFPFSVTIAWNVAGLFTDKSFASGSIDPATDCAGGTPSGIFRQTTTQNNPNTASADGWILLLKIGQNFNDATGWILAQIADYGVLADTHTANFTSGGSQSITAQVNRGDKIWLMWSAAYSNSAGVDLSFNFEYTIAEISITADTTTPPSEATGIAIHEAWSKLSAIITDQPVAFYSQFFGRTNSNIAYPSDGCGSRTAITSGLNIRGFPSSAITTSLKDFFESCNAVWAIGLSVEDYNGLRVLRSEPIYHYYQNVVILTLLNAPNIQMQHTPEIVYNQVELGFAKWNVQSAGGLDEINTKIEYSISKIKSKKNALQLISKFVGGMYAIELTRRKNHIDFATEDTNYDEDCFFICLSKTDLTTPEKDENLSIVTGLLSPETAYNLRLILSSTFDRVKYLLTAGLTKLGNTLFRVTNTEGNANVTYAFIPDGCDGDHFGSTQQNGADRSYPDSTARRENPVWLPEEYSFEYPLSFPEYLTYLTNPYGLIKFSDGQDNFYYGWVRSLEYNVTHKTASFTIIRKFR